MEKLKCCGKSSIFGETERIPYYTASLISCILNLSKPSSFRLGPKPIQKKPCYWLKHTFLSHCHFHRHKTGKEPCHLNFSVLNLFFFLHIKSLYSRKMISPALLASEKAFLPPYSKLVLSSC